MKKFLLKTAVLCAAGALASASALAQSQTDPQSDSMTENSMMGNKAPKEQQQTWSIKHLTATGRMAAHPVRASKVIGCSVNDSSGNRVGRIEDILLNPVSGKIDFAVISPAIPGATAETTATGKLVPVPWSLLESNPNAAGAGFTLKANADKLAQAPTINPENWSEVRQPDWEHQIYSYYGVNEYPTGSAESPQGVTKGSGAEQLERGTQTNSAAPTPQ